MDNLPCINSPYKVKVLIFIHKLRVNQIRKRFKKEVAIGKGIGSSVENGRWAIDLRNWVRLNCMSIAGVLVVVKHLEIIVANDLHPMLLHVVSDRKQRKNYTYHYGFDGRVRIQMRVKKALFFPVHVLHFPSEN